MTTKELRDSADIKRVVECLGVYVKRAGNVYLVKCPCHNDTNPSAFFKEGDNYIYCNVCRKNINAIDLIMEEKGCDFATAKKMLADIEGVSISSEIPRQKPYCPEAVKLTGVKPFDRKYLSEREYSAFLKARTLDVERRIKEVEEFIGISLEKERESLSKLKKQL